MLIVHEDSRTGGIGESLAAIIQEEAFEWLDAPIRIIGALDTPVPYSPPLEEVFLPSEAEIEQAARLLVAYWVNASGSSSEAGLQPRQDRGRGRHVFLVMLMFRPRRSP